MAILNGTPQPITEGTYNIFVEAGTGTVAVLYSVEGLTAQPIDGASYGKDGSNNYRLPACNIHAVLTGTAVAKINTVGG